MFGCVVAGRLLQTNLQQIDETHAIFELPSASTINHVCVFLLGTVPFPEGYGATVHFHWPGKGFQLLGMLSNDKPSAIFRLRGTFTTHTPNHTAFQGISSIPIDASADVSATLGIAVEPLSSIQEQLANMPNALAKSLTRDPLADPTLLAEKIVRHLFNYLSSFAGEGGGGMNAGSYVQLSVVSRWYESFQSKIRAGGLGFLDRTE